MTKFVTWTGTERVVSSFLLTPEEFVASPAVLAAGKVTVLGVISDPARVRLVVEGFVELRNSLVFDRPNFKVVGQDIIFNDIDLLGDLPPAGCKIYVSYPVSTEEDILKESPDIKISSSYDKSTETFKLGAWLHENGQIVSASRCDITLFTFGSPVFVLTKLIPDSENIFYTSNNGSILLPSGLYVVKVTITTADNVYTQVAEVTIISSGNDLGDISAAVWNPQANTFNVAGSMGRTLRDMFQALVGKYLIDFETKTLTIFASDNVTPIKVFNLFDRNGDPATVNIYKRVPQ